MIIHCEVCHHPVSCILPVEHIICHNCWNPVEPILTEPYVYVLSNLEPAVGHHPKLGQHDFDWEVTVMEKFCTCGHPVERHTKLGMGCYGHLMLCKCIKFEALDKFGCIKETK